MVISTVIFTVSVYNTFGYRQESQQIVDSILAISDQYFTSGRTLVVSLPKTTLPMKIFLYNGSKHLLKEDMSTGRDEMVLICGLIDEFHDKMHWPIMISSPTVVVEKPHPPNWDTTNNDLHGSYVLIVSSDDWGQEELLSSVSEQMHKLESYSAWNPRAKFVVVPLFLEEHADSKIAKHILEVLWKWQVLNVVVLLPTLSNTYGTSVQVYTWFPYKQPSGSCGKLKNSVHIDSWVSSEGGEGGFVQNLPFYPNKVPYDLNGCHIRASTFEFHPFVICDPKLGMGTNTSIVDGLEIRLMRCIAEGMKMTLILRIPPGDDRGGIQLKNGTWTGLRADIVYGKADITFASLLNQLVDHLIFDDTINYFTDRFTWFVPRANPYPRWLSMARVFSPQTWLIGLFVLVLSALFMRFLFCLEIVKQDEVSPTYWRYSICLSSMWAITLEEGVPIMPCSLPPRLFFLSMIIYTLAVNTVFQAFFTSYVVNPGLLHQISNVDELVTSDLVYAFYYVLDRFHTADFLQKLKPRLQCEPFTCLDYVATKENYATFCGRALLAYINDELVKQEGKHEIYAFHEDSFELKSVMLMPRGSHLLDRVNEVMSHIVEAGFPNQFLKIILTQRGIEAGIVAVEDLSDEYAPLTVNHLQGAFFFLLMGESLGFAMLIFELLKFSRKKLKLKKILLQSIFTEKPLK